MRIHKILAGVLACLLVLFSLAACQSEGDASLPAGNIEGEVDIPLQQPEMPLSSEANTAPEVSSSAPSQIPPSSAASAASSQPPASSTSSAGEEWGNGIVTIDEKETEEDYNAIMDKLVRAIKAGLPSAVDKLSKNRGMVNVGFWDGRETNSVTYKLISSGEQYLYELVVDTAKNEGDSPFVEGVTRWEVLVGRKYEDSPGLCIYYIRNKNDTVMSEEEVQNTPAAYYVDLMMQYIEPRSFDTPGDLSSEQLVQLAVVLAKDIGQKDGSYETGSAFIDQQLVDQVLMNNLGVAVDYENSYYYVKDQHKFRTLGARRSRSPYVISRCEQKENGKYRVVVQTYRDYLQLNKGESYAFELKKLENGTFRFLSCEEYQNANIVIIE